MLKRLAPYAFLLAITPTLMAPECNAPASDDTGDGGGGNNDGGDDGLDVATYGDQTHGFGTDACPTKLDDLQVSNGTDADMDVTVSAASSDQSVQTIEIGGPGASAPAGIEHTESVTAGGTVAFTMWFNCGIAETNSTTVTVTGGGESATVEVEVEVTGNGR